MDLFSHEIREMIEKDKEFLERGKIVWEDKLMPVCCEIKECLANLNTGGISCNNGDDSLKNRELYWTQKLEIAREKLDCLIEIISDREKTKRIEELATQIKEWKKDCEDREEDHQTFPWSDIALSLLKYPEHVKFDFDKCPDCGGERIKLFFRLPDWTWALMCGRSGEMVICPHCKRQASFRCNRMN